MLTLSYTLPVPFLLHTYARTHTKEERNPHSHSLIFVSLGVFKIGLSTPIQLLISLYVIIHFRSTDFVYFIPKTSSYTPSIFGGTNSSS